MGYLERYFDQPTRNVLAEIKYLLRVLQAQKFSKQHLRLLLTLEAILEKGNLEESCRTRLLQSLQPDTETRQPNQYT